MPKDFRHTSGALEDDYFYGRTDEIELLHNNFNIRQHTALIGQRQCGKTSLVHKAVERHPDAPLYAHIDLTRKSTLAEAAKILVDDFMLENFGIKRFLIAAITTPGTLIKEILKPAKMVKKIKLSEFEIEINELGKLAADDAGAKSVDLFVSGIEFIDMIADRLGKKAIIFIDEFQRIIGFPELREADVLWPLRSVIQESRVSTLIVAGSQPSVVEKIINDPKGAFLHSFIVETIQGVKEEDFSIHFQAVAEHYGVEDYPSATRFVYGICEGIPSYLSLFGRKLFDAVKRKKKLTVEMYYAAIGDTFQAISGVLRLREEKLYAIPMALVVYKAIFAGENPKAEAVRLSGTTDSNIINNTMRPMEEAGYIYRVKRGEYRVVDPIFGYFLAEIVSGEQFATLYEAWISKGQPEKLLHSL